MSYESASQRGRFHSLFLPSLFSHILRHCLLRLRRLLFPPLPSSSPQGRSREGEGKSDMAWEEEEEDPSLRSSAVGTFLPQHRGRKASGGQL